MFVCCLETLKSSMSYYMIKSKKHPIIYSTNLSAFSTHCTLSENYEYKQMRYFLNDHVLNIRLQSFNGLYNYFDGILVSLESPIPTTYDFLAMTMDWEESITKGEEKLQPI